MPLVSSVVVVVVVVVVEVGCGLSFLEHPANTIAQAIVNKIFFIIFFMVDGRYQISSKSKDRPGAAFAIKYITNY